MKASIKQDGTLIVVPESALEAYALKMWSKNYCATGNIVSLTPSALQICENIKELDPADAFISDRDKVNRKKTLLQAVTEWTLAENDAKKILNIVADWVDRKIGDYPTFVVAEWIRNETTK
jgi:hypothetical protein